MIAKGGLEACGRAIFVTAITGAAADTAGANHLAIDDDRNSTGASEETELCQLSRVLSRIVLQLGRNDRGGLTILQCCLCFQQSCADIVVSLSVAAFLMYERAMRVDDVDRGGAAMLRGEGTAGLSNLFCRCTRNLVSIVDRRCAPS